MKIEVYLEDSDAIVRSDLKSVLSSLKVDLRKRKGGDGVAVFDTDKATDIAEMQRHIDALNLVLKYYGG